MKIREIANDFLQELKMTAQELYRHSQQAKILRRLDRLPTNIYVPKFSDWAEENRYLPPGVSNYPGRMTYDIMPHVREIVDNLHPDTDINHVSVMKSVQSGVTTGAAETAIGSFIKYKLGSVLYLTTSKSVGRVRSSSAIDVMIDHSGLAESVKPISTRMKRKTADSTYYKEFAGGIKLMISSYQSIGDLKSNTFHLIIKDEWDEAGAEIKDQGDLEGVIHGRTMGVLNFKILDISTPSRMESSRIYKSFLEGDQRLYFVPCPICGEMQVLTLKGGDKNYGLTFSRETDKVTGHKVLIPETVRYICQYCQGEFYESKKQDMLTAGQWRPTAVPQNKKHRSYHISAFMAPEMFLSWERICQQFIATGFGEDLLLFKDFTINYLGRPWAAIQRNMEWTEIRDRAESYSHGEVPEGAVIKTESGDKYTGPLILTGGVDVQKDRLELHVVGFGSGMEKWSIDYKIFYGTTANLDDPCWTALSDWIYGHTYKILGKESYIAHCCIDSGYDPRAARAKDWAGKNHIVYEFVSARSDRFKAVMGVNEDKSIDIMKEARVDGSTLKKRYNVSVSVVKEMLMSSLEVTSGPGAIHFPKYTMIEKQRRELPDDFFRQFLSERYQELTPKKFGWKKIYKRNEVWDTFIYAVAAASFLGLSTWTNDRWMWYRYKILTAE